MEEMRNAESVGKPDEKDVFGTFVLKTTHPQKVTKH